LKIVIFVYHIVESIAEERPAIGLNHVIYISLKIIHVVGYIQLCR